MRHIIHPLSSSEHYSHACSEPFSEKNMFHVAVSCFFWPLSTSIKSGALFPSFPIPTRPSLAPILTASFHLFLLSYITFLPVYDAGRKGRVFSWHYVILRVDIFLFFIWLYLFIAGVSSNNFLSINCFLNTSGSIPSLIHFVSPRMRPYLGNSCVWEGAVIHVALSFAPNLNITSWKGFKKAPTPTWTIHLWMENKRHCWKVSWSPLRSCRIILFHPFAQYHNSFILAEKIHRPFKSEYLESGSVAAPPCFSWAHTVCLIPAFSTPSVRSRTFLWPVELIIIALPLSIFQVRISPLRGNAFASMPKKRLQAFIAA